jgi:hypothetical protein
MTGLLYYVLCKRENVRSESKRYLTKTNLKEGAWGFEAERALPIGRILRRRMGFLKQRGPF